MKIIFWGNGQRGEACLAALRAAKFDLQLAVLHPQGATPSSLFRKVREAGLECITPDDPNSESVIDLLRSFKPDLFVLAGYGKILRAKIIDVPARMAINLHAGRLPDFRGSSPLNWALIRGESSVTLSVIKVDEGVDTGDILVEKKFPVTINTTIRDLHEIANVEFPQLLVTALKKVAKSKRPSVRRQDKSKGAYYPLRFPEDGVIFWDMFTHDQVHNRIRALTHPYPLAFTYFNGRRVNLLASELHDRIFYGESGRIYQKTSRGLLVCAQDRCLWITSAVFADDGTPLATVAQRYDTLATVRETAMRSQRA